MNQPGLYLGRAYDGYLISLRKKIALFLVCLFVVVAIAIYSSLIVRVQRKYTMKQQVADMQNRLRFLESNYNEISEAATDKRSFRNDVLYGRRNRSSYNITEPDISWTNESPAVYDLLKNLTGTRTAAGIYTANNQQLRIAFIYQLLPHLMEDADSLKPAYHMRSSRYFTDLVVGIPTHKRGQESFLIFTLTQLVNGLTPADKENTLIIVFIAETDIEYVINMARKIEITFPTQVEDGLIEVFSPSPSYYPNYETLRGTMGDSREKVKRQAKENLDNIFLMAYAQCRGMYVLLLADDIIANENYIKVIRKFTISVTVSNPKWFYIEYCHVGGIGKLFRSADLIHFITYVQLFYKNQPFDWLLESYLADKTCVVLQISNTCSETKELIQPKYKLPLFQQIGLYTSENENNQNLKDLQIEPDPTFYPHTSNPPLQSLKTDIWVHPDHSLEAAYEGKTFFWGKTPKKGDIIEFWFKKPITLDRYKFRSGNSEHNTDKFYDTCVEVLPVRDNIAYTPINCFDAVGLAEGRLMEQIAAIRLKVNRDSNYWVILSEIQLSEYQPPDKGS